MKKRVLVPFTTGVEEIEFTCIVDILRRAAVEVVTVSLEAKQVTGRSGITLQADSVWSDIEGQVWDMVVLPGGLPNAHLLRDDMRVQSLLQEQQQAGKPVAAICAAPTALAAAGVLGKRHFTVYPSCETEILSTQPSSQYEASQAVVDDQGVITSQGPGTAISFALHLVQDLCGEEVAEQVRQQLLA